MQLLVRFRVMLLAVALAASIAVGLNAYGGGFQSCFADNCPGGCWGELWNCDWCDSGPDGCDLRGQNCESADCGCTDPSYECLIIYS